MTEGSVKYMPPEAVHSLYRNGKVYMQRDASGDDSTWVGTDLVDHLMTIGDARSLVIANKISVSQVFVDIKSISYL